MSRIGTRIPTCVIYSVEKVLGGPDTIKLKYSGDYFANRKVIYFSVPGAFTPTCTNNQLPGFERNYEKFKELGIDGIVCASVNDGHVMNGWFEKLNIKNIECFPDGNGEFTWAMGMQIPKTHLGWGDRSWRYAMIVNDGIIESWFEEPGMNEIGADIDPYGETTPDNVLGVLNHLKENKQPEVSDD